MAEGTIPTELQAFIEEALAALATKADLDNMRADMATKADRAGIAKNVDITALGRDIRELRDEMRVTSAIVLRLDHM